MSKWTDEWASQFRTIGDLNKTIKKKMSNKNPERPKDIDRVISQLLNPKKTKEDMDLEKYKLTQEKIRKLIWD